MGTLIICHDGSYMVDLDHTSCSAAFLIYCRTTGNTAIGSVAERSDAADNYRGEILGALMIQLVLRAATAGRNLPYKKATVFCDNRGVVLHGNRPRASLPEKQAQADVLRCLKQYVTENLFDVQFEWVKSHQDDHTPFEQLCIEAQLNVRVDRLAKRALKMAIADGDFISNHFPFEQIRITVGGKKLTALPKATVYKRWAYITAKELYHDRRIIHSKDFDSVWWTGVETVNKRFPKMFGVWWTKHVSHFSGTNQQLARIDSTVENKCPSCGAPDESTSHITRCRDEGRVRMLRASVKDIVNYLGKMQTDQDLIDMIQRYLLGHGQVKMRDICAEEKYRELARIHDTLGWDNFVGGRIPHWYLQCHRLHRAEEGKFYAVEKWGRGLIERLVQLTHKQWLFRNSHIHYKKLEGLSRAQHEEIFVKVQNMMHTDPDELLPKHQLLLEVDFSQLGKGTTADRMYWVSSMESALTAADYIKDGGETVDVLKAMSLRNKLSTSDSGCRTEESCRRVGVLV